MTYEAVNIGPMLKTARPSLYEVLYFAVLLDHCLIIVSCPIPHLSIFHCVVF